MVTFNRIALAVAFGLSLPALASNYTLGIPHSSDVVISPETQAAANDLINSANQQARDVIASGELDWIDQLSAKHTPSSDPLNGESGDAASIPDLPDQADQPPHPLGDGFKTFIFVSWSMGEGAIRDILQRYDGRDSTAIVFRGVPDGQPFAQAVMDIQALSLDTQSSLSVLMDPVAFKTHGIASAPSVAIETPEGKTLIKATGISSPDRLQEYLDDDRAGDLGRLGPSLEIVERDLIEIAEERVAELDFDQMKQQAIDNFWNQQTGHPLPTAIEDRLRHIDPSIVIHEPILDQEGNVVTPAGRINPLDIMPFDQTLVIIDPASSWQVAMAADVVRNTASERQVTVIATQIDPTEGWDMFSRTEQAIDAALYLLPPALAKRFNIEKTPSIVTADDRSFIVQELSKSSAEEGHHVR